MEDMLVLKKGFMKKHEDDISSLYVISPEEDRFIYRNGERLGLSDFKKMSPSDSNFIDNLVDAFEDGGNELVVYRGAWHERLARSYMDNSYVVMRKIEGFVSESNVRNMYSKLI